MKVVTVRLQEDELGAIEEIRRQRPGVTQSELIREAVRDWLRARRRERLREELAKYAADESNLHRMGAFAEWLEPISEEALRRAQATSEEDES